MDFMGSKKHKFFGDKNSTTLASYLLKVWTKTKLYSRDAESFKEWSCVVCCYNTCACNAITLLDSLIRYTPMAYNQKIAQVKETRQ